MRHYCSLSFHMKVSLLKVRFQLLVSMAASPDHFDVFCREEAQVLMAFDGHRLLNMLVGRR